MGWGCMLQPQFEFRSRGRIYVIHLLIPFNPGQLHEFLQVNINYLEMKTNQSPSLFAAFQEYLPAVASSFSFLLYYIVTEPFQASLLTK